MRAAKASDGGSERAGAGSARRGCIVGLAFVAVLGLAACSGPVVETVTEPLIDGPTEGQACRVAEDQGRLTEAEAACQRALEAARRTYALAAPASGGGQTGSAGATGGTARKSPDPAAQAYSMRLYNLARIKRKLARYGEAEVLYRRSLEIEEIVSGPTSTWVARRLIELAISQGQQGHWTDGAANLERALPIVPRLPAAERTTTMSVVAQFVEALRARGQSAWATRLERGVAALKG